MTSKKIYFVVEFINSYYSSERVLRAYTSKDAAQKFIEAKQSKIKKILSKHSQLMLDVEITKSNQTKSNLEKFQQKYDTFDVECTSYLIQEIELFNK